jgi:hypothetical protein
VSGAHVRVGLCPPSPDMARRGEGSAGLAPGGSRPPPRCDASAHWLQTRQSRRFGAGWLAPRPTPSCRRDGVSRAPWPTGPRRTVNHDLDLRHPERTPKSLARPSRRPVHATCVVEVGQPSSPQAAKRPAHLGRNRSYTCAAYSPQHAPGLSLSAVTWILSYPKPAFARTNEFAAPSRNVKSAGILDACVLNGIP